MIQIVPSSSIKVSSLDPKAAARVAVILKIVHHDGFLFLTIWCLIPF